MGNEERAWTEGNHLDKACFLRGEMNRLIGLSESASQSIHHSISFQVSTIQITIRKSSPSPPSIEITL
jgi:ABC-type microcin C transport system permease subunit YejE